MTQPEPNRIDKLENQTNKLEYRMDKIDNKVDKVDNRVDKVDNRMDKFDNGQQHTRESLSAEIAKQNVEMKRGLVHLALGMTLWGGGIVITFIVTFLSL